jgi:glycosyltransferase involved in cell wall biosynthesis
VAPQFSVVIATHDRPDLLRRAVGSVLAQTVADLEVIVVDDASVCPPELPPDPRVRLIVHDFNSGPAGARNTGIAAARGDAVVFLDDDDEYTPRRLAIAAAGLQHAPVTACSKRFVSATGLVVERSASEDVDRFMASRWLHVGQLAIRRDLVPRFDERFLTSEDHEWAIRIVQRDRPWPVDEVGYIVADHPGVHVSGGDGLQLFRDRVLMLERRCPATGAWLGGRSSVRWLPIPA